MVIGRPMGARMVLLLHCRGDQGRSLFRLRSAFHCVADRFQLRPRPLPVGLTLLVHIASNLSGALAYGRNAGSSIQSSRYANQHRGPVTGPRSNGKSCCEFRWPRIKHNCQECPEGGELWRGRREQLGKNIAKRRREVILPFVTSGLQSSGSSSTPAVTCQIIVYFFTLRMGLLGTEARAGP